MKTSCQETISYGECELIEERTRQDKRIAELEVELENCRRVLRDETESKCQALSLWESAEAENAELRKRLEPIIEAAKRYLQRTSFFGDRDFEVQLKAALDALEVKP